MKTLGGLTIAAIIVASMAGAAQAQAQSRTDFTIDGRYKGASSTEKCFENLCVSLYVKAINVNQGKSEICAKFSSTSSAKWSGAYRLTQRDDPTTFATMDVLGGDTATRCEILPPEMRYYVVLRQN